MRLIVVIVLFFLSNFNSYSQERRLALALKQIEIDSEKTELFAVLNKIVSHQKFKYGSSDTLCYYFLISKSDKSISERIGNFESIYITGIDTSWPMPPSAFMNVLGYIEFGNIIFIVSDGGGFSRDYFSGVFSNLGSERTFLFKEFNNKEVKVDDDTVIRIWCHFFYKEGDIKVFDSSCHDNNGGLSLFNN
jgi:hypothetical protein